MQNDLMIQFLNPNWITKSICLCSITDGTFLRNLYPWRRRKSLFDLAARARQKTPPSSSCVGEERAFLGDGDVITINFPHNGRYCRDVFPLDRLSKNASPRGNSKRSTPGKLKKWERTHRKAERVHYYCSATQSRLCKTAKSSKGRRIKLRFNWSSLIRLCRKYWSTTCWTSVFSAE